METPPTRTPPTGPTAPTTAPTTGPTTAPTTGPTTGSTTAPTTGPAASPRAAGTEPLTRHGASTRLQGSTTSDVAGVPVEVRRSRRRTRTVSAYRDGDRIVVMIPARMSRREEREWVETMVARVTAAERRRRPSDGDLAERAARLSARYLDSRAKPTSVRWVSNQRSRWGSCTPADGTIRLSTRLQGMPAYVIDYVLLHELTHLVVHGHDEQFWSWVNRYDMTERARGFLEGVSETANLAISDDVADEEELSS